jgi:hypothetical protein
LDLEKNLFWKLVPCIEVTLVSKFHSILSTIAQESNLEKWVDFMRKLRFTETSYQTMFGLTGLCLT